MDPLSVLLGAAFVFAVGFGLPALRRKRLDEDAPRGNRDTHELEDRVDKLEHGFKMLSTEWEDTFQKLQGQVRRMIRFQGFGGKPPLVPPDAGNGEEQLPPRPQTHADILRQALARRRQG